MCEAVCHIISAQNIDVPQGCRMILRRSEVFKYFNLLWSEGRNNCHKRWSECLITKRWRNAVCSKILEDRTKGILGGKWSVAEQIVYCLYDILTDNLKWHVNFILLIIWCFDLYIYLSCVNWSLLRALPAKLQMFCGASVSDKVFIRALITSCYREPLGQYSRTNGWRDLIIEMNG